MSILNFPKCFRYIVAVMLLFALCSAAICQSPPATTAKKSKSKAESCDGAADIVPVKPMSFVRKRRPAAKEPSAATKSDKS